jgi:uncharacterized protein YvpB
MVFFFGRGKGTSSGYVGAPLFIIFVSYDLESFSFIWNPAYTDFVVGGM